MTRLKDVARVELGAADYTTNTHYDGLPAVGIGVFQLPGTNSIATANAIYEKMEELKASFPRGIDYSIPYDTTTFVRDSIRDVIDDAVRGGRAGGPGRARVPAKLAGGHRAACWRFPFR